MNRCLLIRSPALLLPALLLITAACSPIQPENAPTGATIPERAQQPSAGFDYLTPGYLPEGYSLQRATATAGSDGDGGSPDIFAREWRYAGEEGARLILEQSSAVAGQRLENLPEIGRVSLLGEEVSVYRPAENVRGENLDVYRLATSDLSITLRTDGLSSEEILQVIRDLAPK